MIRILALEQLRTEFHFPPPQSCDSTRNWLLSSLISIQRTVPAEFQPILRQRGKMLKTSTTDRKIWLASFHCDSKNRGAFTPGLSKIVIPAKAGFQALACPIAGLTELVGNRTRGLAGLRFTPSRSAPALHQTDPRQARYRQSGKSARLRPC